MTFIQFLYHPLIFQGKHAIFLMGTQLQIAITIDLQLLRFLTKASPGKTSRTDAFLYLIQCQERLLEIDFEGGLKVPFLISITSLSSMWKWNKRTVMAFMETLQRHGAIEVKKNWNGTLVRMLNMTKISPQTADEIL